MTLLTSFVTQVFILWPRMLPKHKAIRETKTKGACSFFFTSSEQMLAIQFEGDSHAHH